MLARTQGVDEIRPVIAGVMPGWARLLLFAQKCVIGGMVFVRDGHVSLGAVEDIADGIRFFSGAGFIDPSFVVADPMAHFKNHKFLFAGAVEFKSRRQGVGSFLVIVEHKMAAHGADLRGVLHAQTPPRDVHLMDSLVSEVSVAVIPEPVPVIVKTVTRELMLRRGTKPQIVVHACGHGLDGLSADGVAPLKAQPARHVNIADYALAQLLHRLARNTGTAVRTVLHQTVIFLRGRHDLLRFKHVVGARLLYVYVLARLASPHYLQRVIVIRRSNRNRIDGLVFEQLAEIRECGWTFLAQLLDVSQAGVQHGLVDVTKCGDFHAIHLGVTRDMGAALPAYAHAGNANRVIGARKAARTESSGAGSNRAHQKMASIH